MNRFLVVREHVSEFPDPICFSKGDSLKIREKYVGPEDWNDWYYCVAGNQKEGWVPEQVIDWQDQASGIALEDYTARELDVAEGDILSGQRVLNGWQWCQKENAAEAGWVPLANLKALQS